MEIQAGRVYDQDSVFIVSTSTEWEHKLLEVGRSYKSGAVEDSKNSGKRHELCRPQTTKMSKS